MFPTSRSISLQHNPPELIFNIKMGFSSRVAFKGALGDGVTRKALRCSLGIENSLLEFPSFLFDFFQNKFHSPIFSPFLDSCVGTQRKCVGVSSCRHTYWVYALVI